MCIRTVNVIEPGLPLVNAFDFRSASLNSEKTIVTFADNTTATVSGTTSEVSISSTDGVRTQTNSHIVLPNFAVSTDFTIELYVKIESHGTWHGLLGLYDSPSNRNNLLHIGNFRGNNQLYIISGEATYYSHTANIQNQGTSEADGTFYTLPYLVHIVWTNDATGSVFYLDGTVKTMFVQNGSSTIYTRSGATSVLAQIGKSQIGDTGIENTRYLRHYNTKLSASDVAQLYADRDN